MPELRKRSRWEYLKKREEEKLEDLEAEIIDDEYLFSKEELTERERRELEYKRTLRDLAKDYKQAGAKEQEERKNRYYMPEERRSKVSRASDRHGLANRAGLSQRLPPAGRPPEGSGAGRGPHGAGGGAGPLGGGAAEDGLPQLRSQEGARAGPKAGAGPVPAGSGGGGDDRLRQHGHHHEGDAL